jgi:hypothetical protein
MAGMLCQNIRKSRCVHGLIDSHRTDSSTRAVPSLVRALQKKIAYFARLGGRFANSVESPLICRDQHWQGGVIFVANDAFCKGERNVQLQHETQLVLYFGKLAWREVFCRRAVLSAGNKEQQKAAEATTKTLRGNLHRTKD